MKPGTATMKAAVIRRHGDLDGLRVEEVPVPEPGPGEVRVRVRACGLNRLDVFALQGLRGPGVRGVHLPHVSGVDIAGVVDALGPGVIEPGPGTPVVVYSGLYCGGCRWCRQGEPTMCRHYRILGEDTWGGLAEYTVVPAANLVTMPPGAAFVTTAAAPVAHTTAWRMVITTAGLRAGETVLVLGASGGVGVAAVQISRLAGARVLAAAGGAEKCRRLADLGADAVVDYLEQNFEAWTLDQTGGEGVDVVVNPVGGDTWRPAVRSLAMGGRMVMCGATAGDSPDISIREIYQSHRRILGAPMGSLEDFRQVMAAVWQGRITPVVETRVPLETAAMHEAYRRIRERRHFGKVVVVPGGEQA